MGEYTALAECSELCLLRLKEQRGWAAGELLGVSVGVSVGGSCKRKATALRGCKSERKEGAHSKLGWSLRPLQWKPKKKRGRVESDEIGCAVAVRHARLQSRHVPPTALALLHPGRSRHSLTVICISNEPKRAGLIMGNLMPMFAPTDSRARRRSLLIVVVHLAHL